ncbi:hypothetical protein [Mycobacterium gastri]|uniref:Uncharacterized protein n=1 Tax=Mycobacterium gastri TaxID=1777 RepID=A0A1X1V208_MYCGS|nr:hypothetical protein [Mycobacterium gastri]ETW22849.1 hypothetical protein MGAST_17610 [Mycobacterium gastri 'Wayne']ORV62988.1 hypothetical protein AWC07_16735 [Mycobacterium gastri]
MVITSTIDRPRAYQASHGLVIGKSADSTLSAAASSKRADLIRPGGSEAGHRKRRRGAVLQRASAQIGQLATDLGHHRIK